MKRLKRDQDTRAYKHGYKQGLKGRAWVECPYGVPEKRGHWLGGWRIGYAQYVAGYRF